MPKEKETITQIIEYDITTAAIEEMKQKYSGMKIIDAKSDKAVREARTFMVSKRTAVEKRRVELNDEANKHRRRVNEKAKEITTLLLPIEEPLQAECKRVDDEKERIKKEKAEKEQQRKDEIWSRIDEIPGMLIGLLTMPLDVLQRLSDKLEKIEITDDFMEFQNEAEKALDATYNTVQDAIATRIKLDKEAEERKAEDARLEKLKTKLEAVKKKADAAQKQIDEDNRRIGQARTKLEDDKKADEDRKKQEAFEKEATEKADAVAAQKVKDDALKKEEEEDAAEAEKARKEALKPDKEKLIKFAGKLIDLLLNMPKVKYPKAQKIIDDAANRIDELHTDIKEQAKDL